jgi:Ni,Fe-hydrogenase I cytochrome b subunit
MPGNESDVSPDSRTEPPRRYSYARHSLIVRITHWINALALTLLFMSGLQIFNAHPNLYWGQSSYSQRPAVLAIGAGMTAGGHWSARSFA